MVWGLTRPRSKSGWPRCSWQWASGVGWWLASWGWTRPRKDGKHEAEVAVEKAGHLREACAQQGGPKGKWDSRRSKRTKLRGRPKRRRRRYGKLECECLSPGPGKQRPRRGKGPVECSPRSLGESLREKGISQRACCLRLLFVTTQIA